MANYNFDTITAEEALAYKAGDTLTFAAGVNAAQVTVAFVAAVTTTDTAEAVAVVVVKMS